MTSFKSQKHSILLSMALPIIFGVSSVSATGNDAKQQEMFAAMKQIKIDGIQGRLSILQTALNCVNSASSHEQMKPCEESEHQAMDNLQQQQKAKWDALKSQKQ